MKVAVIKFPINLNTTVSRLKNFITYYLLRK